MKDSRVSRRAFALTGWTLLTKHYYQSFLLAKSGITPEHLLMWPPKKINNAGIVQEIFHRFINNCYKLELLELVH